MLDKNKQEINNRPFMKSLFSGLLAGFLLINGAVSQAQAETTRRQ